MLSDYNDWFEYIMQNINIWPINLDILCIFGCTVAHCLNRILIIDNPMGLIENQNCIVYVLKKLINK